MNEFPCLYFFFEIKGNLMQVHLLSMANNYTSFISKSKTKLIEHFESMQNPFLAKGSMIAS